MLRLPCPLCGLRDETEFSYGGDATRRRPPQEESSEEAWLEHVFLRENPRGPHREFWHHVNGCRQWLVVERDTLTHVVGRSWLAREQER